MNGPTAMRELRRREATAGLARLLCIAVTGNAREEQKAGCLEAGYDYVATKVRSRPRPLDGPRLLCTQPYTLDHLVSLIESKTVDSRGDTPML
jgi:CheY-like chemotaxis protein